MTIPDEVIERVAEAINSAWDKSYQTQARAAIDALMPWLREQLHPTLNAKARAAVVDALSLHEVMESATFGPALRVLLTLHDNVVALDAKLKGGV